MNPLSTLLLRIPRNGEVTPEAAQTFLAALTQINTVSTWDKIRGQRGQVVSLEIVLVEGQILFLITTDTDLVPFVEAQIQSNYPLVRLEKINDPLGNRSLDVAALSLSRGNYYPISSYPAFQDVDPLSSILTLLSKQPSEQFVIVQYSLQAISGSWQSAGQRLMERGGGKNEEGVYLKHPDETIIKEKISYPGFAVSFRVASSAKKTLTELKSAFGVFTRTDGNGFSSKRSGVLGKRDGMRELRERKITDNQVLNIAELATIWHLPSEKVKTANIAWGAAVLSEAPDNLPVSANLAESDKASFNFFAKTLYRNVETTFGIKTKDRQRHVWVVGKSGTGKSTMIANMVIDDVKKDKGIAVIDPHGDLVETILDYIPSHRINDTVLFNPADREYPITINPLGVRNREEAELVVSGLMSVFTKIWANVWSARMEYILRNTLLTLAQVEGTTLSDVLAILADDGYRNNIVQQIKDEPLRQFWLTEYNKMPERLQKEAISPIQNKVGQFVTSPMIRNIIGVPHSSIDIDSIMNEGKILLCNLSQGRIGEDNSALLGATLITKIQQAAMRRVDTDEGDRRDFYLYVDEFQNFATTSFIKILSEARKYRLNLMLANQYMAQIPEEVQAAILGNVGTLASFRVGADDAEIIHKEFSEVFSQGDLVNLSNFQIAIKLLIDGQSSRPFLAHTLPLPASINQNREKAIRISRERWSLSRREADEMMGSYQRFRVEKRNNSSQGQQGGGRPQHHNNRPRQPHRQQRN